MTLLVGQKEGHPAYKKTEWCCAGMVICLERGADLHMAQLMPLPLTVSCFSEIQIGFTFVVPAHPGSPRKRALNGCVCVCVCVCKHHVMIGMLTRVSIFFLDPGKGISQLPRTETDATARQLAYCERDNCYRSLGRPGNAISRELTSLNCHA